MNAAPYTSHFRGAEQTIFLWAKICEGVHEPLIPALLLYIYACESVHVSSVACSDTYSSGSATNIANPNT